MQTLPTQTTRQIYNLSKTHTIDSYLIALEEVINPKYLNIPTTRIYYHKQFRRHNHRLCAATRNRYYKLNGSTIANNRNKRMDQKVPSLAEYRQTMLKKHHKKQVDHHISNLKVTPSIKRYNTSIKLIPVRSGDTVLYQGVRQAVSGYFNKGKTLRLVSMPTNNIPVKECQLLLRNTGIVCV